MSPDLEMPSSERIPVYNGVSDEVEWSCAGFRFERAPDYELQLQKLPTSPSGFGDNIQPGQKGEHVVTFTAIPLKEPERGMFFEDATSLEDVTALWSFVGRFEVVTPRSNVHRPSGKELNLALVGAEEVAQVVTAAYGRLRARPICRRSRSALLTYLEIRHVRPLQIEAALLCSVLECLAPIGAPSDDRQRYRPIVDLLAALPVAVDIGRGRIEQLVVVLFGFRNEFLHGGVYPYRDDIEISSAMTTIGRAVHAARILTKFAVASALKFDPVKPGVLGVQIRAFFEGGTFIPAALAKLFQANEP
jgi:hypothetical protein